MTLAKKIYYFVFYTIYGLTKYLPMLSGDFFRYVILKLFLKKIEGWITVRDNVTFWFPERICIGRGTVIGENCFLDGYGGLSIGKDVLIAHSTSCLSEDHGFASRKIKIRDQQKTFQEIVIQDGCWIGCGVRILKGVKIGKGAIIGAGSVVTKNLPAFSISAGVPAKVIKMRPKDE